MGDLCRAPGFGSWGASRARRSVTNLLQGVRLLVCSCSTVLLWRLWISGYSCSDEGPRGLAALLFIFLGALCLYFTDFPPLPDPSTIFLPSPFLFFVKFTYGRVTLYCTNVKSVKRVQFPKNHCIKEMLWRNKSMLSTGSLGSLQVERGQWDGPFAWCR